MRTFLDALPGADSKCRRPDVAVYGSMNSFTTKENTNMKTSILLAAMVACTLSASIVSAQEKAALAKPAMNMDMDKHMPQMQENMKKCSNRWRKSGQQPTRRNARS